MKFFSFLNTRSFLPIYGVGIIGAFLQITAGQWDVSAHILGIVETFFTPAHAALYTGIGLVALASLAGLFLWLKRDENDSSQKFLFTGWKIAIVGTGIQLVAGPFDFWWHSVNGFDPYLFTPPHSMLIVGILLGGIGMTLGMIRLLQVERSGLQLTRRSWIVPAFVVVGVAALWAQLNFASYWLTDLYGISYTFGYCNRGMFDVQTCSIVNDYHNIANLVSFGMFAAAGTIAFWTLKRVFPQKIGMFTLAGIAVVGIYAIPALGFLAYALENLNPPGSFYFTNPSPTQGADLVSFILRYLIVLLPVVALDLSTRLGKNGRLNLHSPIIIALSAITGPILAFVDGRFALGISQSNLSMFGLTIALSFMIIGGVLGGTILTRLIIPQLAIELPLTRSEWRTRPLSPRPAH